MGRFLESEQDWVLDWTLTAANELNPRNSTDRDQVLDAEIQRLKEEARDSQELAVKLVMVVGMMGKVLKKRDGRRHEVASAARGVMVGDRGQ
jgi:hypothetical protein